MGRKEALVLGVEEEGWPTEDDREEPVEVGVKYLTLPR
jgi:hypothetical protein